MKPDGKTTNFAPGRGGLERDPQSIPTHHFPGAADEELLLGAAELKLQTQREGGKIQVTVDVKNTGAGHHLPTGSPLRHLILVVTARVGGESLTLVDGPTIPAWGGEGDPARGYFGGQPGTIYAKVLQDVWIGEAPTAAYWNPTRIVSDNRIPARESDTTRYEFAAASGEGTVRVEARLLLRRAFKKLNAMGLIEVNRSKITILDPDGLADLADS